ncbi:mRNA surveillance protein pelota [Candidatus Micrarchaeota archaeon]|nr:mRNA surveillance protein pelota [Candidatus Micrarchaeota archaeon]
MKIMFLDKKSGQAKLSPETLEDLWHLENIFSIGDRIGSRTLRTVKIGTKEDKAPVFIAVDIEDIEFSKDVNRLRLRGKIVETNNEELIQLGRYHSLDVVPGTILKVLNKNWKPFQIKRLKEAEKESKKPKIRIVVLDEEKALTAIVRGYGVDMGPEFYNRASKKEGDYQSSVGKYFSEIMDYIKKSEEKTVVAGPGFTKDNFKEYVKRKEPELLKRLVFENCSYAEINGINELLKKGVIEKISGEERLEKEAKLLDELIMHIHKDDGLATYGLEHVKKAAEYSAIKSLLIMDELVRTSDDADYILDLADKSKADVIIFSKESDTGLTLKGLGKIAAILRFQIEI